MRLMVTGYEGYIGAHVYDSFVDMPGVEVFGFTPKKDNDAEWASAHVTLHLLNRMRDLWIDTVVHCGAVGNPQYANPDIYFWNTMCANSLARYAELNDIKLIFLSSGMASNPTTHYAMSKFMSEEYIHLHNPSACMLRLFNVWGKEEAKPPARVSVPTQILEHRLEYLFDIYRDYVHIDDVARAIHIATHHEGLFDVGTGVSVSAAALCELVGYTGAKQADPAEVLGMRPVHKLLAENPLPGLEAVSVLERLTHENS